jgi:hypothetical protein
MVKSTRADIHPLNCLPSVISGLILGVQYITALLYSRL